MESFNLESDLQNKITKQQGQDRYLSFHLEFDEEEIRWRERGKKSFFYMGPISIKFYFNLNISLFIFILFIFIYPTKLTIHIFNRLA